MAWGNSSEAYDFSWFEERNAGTSAAVERRAQELERKKEQQERKAEVIELPQARPNHQALKRKALVLTKVLGFLVICGLVANLIYCHAILTELTDEIETAQSVLAEQQSIEIQLETKRAEKYTSDFVKSYAAGQLGMRQVTDSQIEYFNVYHDDVGTVVQNNDDGNALEGFFNRIIEGIS